MKKHLVNVLVIMLVMGSVKVFSAQRVQFSDVPSQAWYLEDLQYLLSHAESIISGYPDGTFRPNDTLTVDMFIKLTVTAMGDQVESGGEYWAAPYIQKAFEKGYILPSDSFWPTTGNTVNTYEPFKKPITREGMALIIGRALDQMSGNRPYRDPNLFSGLILDYRYISSNAKANVVKCYDLGVLSGFPDGEFKPRNQLTRAEVVSVIRRLIDPASRKNFTIAIAAPSPTPIPVEVLNRPVAKDLGNGIIEVEGIRIDPAIDYTSDGAMKLIKAEEYVNVILKYIRFYENDGKARMRGYIPELPEGFTWSFKLKCNVKQPDDRGVYGGIYTNEKEEQPEYKLSSGTFDVSLYTHRENISGLVLTCEIVSRDQKSGGRFIISFTDNKYTTDDFYGGFDGSYPFDTESFFEW